MGEETTLPEDESVETYDLDVDVEDETTELEREAAIRAAVEAVDRSRRSEGDEAEAAEAGSSAEPQAGSSTPSPATGGQVMSELEQELAEERERSLRTLADFENYRRRVEREREEARRAATAEPLREFLDVIDNLERALASEATGEELAVGVEMILRQMRELTRRFGVEAVDAKGEAFDPAVHEAVARNESAEVTVPTVMEELQRGYVMRDRLLRPSRVVVAVPPERSERDNPSPSQDGLQSDADANLEED